MSNKSTSSLIISVSGLRGLCPETLNPEVVQRYVFAYASFMKMRHPELIHAELPFLIANDGRDSAAWITTEVQRAVAEAGLTSMDIGTAATPTVGFLTKFYGYPGAIQITASHNPQPWNGLKLFNDEGRVIPAEQGERIRKFYDNLTLDEFALDAEFDEEEEPLGQDLPAPPAKFQAPHVEAILEHVDAKAIKKRKFSVFVDANHGAGSILTKILMKKLGCAVVWSNADETPDGNFAHVPEPTAENLMPILGAAAESGANVGFCLDPDADRLAILDENGVYVGEEATVALCARSLFAAARVEGVGRVVVTNCASSLMTRDVVREFGCEYAIAPVGEANVVDKMQQTHAIFGGEGNGGPIFPPVGWVRDSFVGMAFVLDLMARTGKSVSELVAELPKYAIEKRKIQMPSNKLSALYDEVRNSSAEASVDTQDGLRLSWEGAWLLVRPSNTEPVVRIIAEARTPKKATALCDFVANIAQDILHGDSL
ncbi:MAG: phosphoglucosamine mutase [Planctomycetia bacterium]|nr:phosphoglucosamine mutase [Planctomycetia bacterium]